MAAKRHYGSTLDLASGGTITVALSVDLFTLGADDRTFVFGLIDEMAAYAKAHPTPEPVAAVAPAGGKKAAEKGGEA